MSKTITVWVSTIQHKHGINTDVAASEAGAEENIATFCREWWEETVVSNDDEDYLSAEEYEKAHSRKEMIERYFQAENEFGGSETADITSHDVTSDNW